MSWGRLDDRSAFHPKVVAVGNAAWGAFMRMVAHCCAHHPSGVIPGPMAKLIANDGTMEVLLSVAIPGKSPLLEDAGEDGYRIHDFQDYCNPHSTRANASETSRKRSEAGKLGASKRWQTDGRANGKPMAGPMAGLLANGSSPVPVPVPVPEERDQTKNKPVPEDPAPLVLVSTEPKLDPAAKVFAAYLAAREEHHPKGLVPKLTGDRRKLVSRWLKDGYTVETLSAAAAGIWRSAFHRGDNDRGKEYASFEQALRSAKHIEDFASLGAHDEAGGDEDMLAEMDAIIAARPRRPDGTKDAVVRQEDFEAYRAAKRTESSEVG